ncbi:phenol hydroxylase [Diaphorobacter sp. HDW4B]|uniref:phenol hydroxylase subunit n=1 Tax=Diaphorobacter sp. HDW4B TaxID=2714925 RepID=UPI001407B834|nr:phenol hydroxylase subunit [Diaphorobacter sp. HDW4B]QIL72072.1 phenol hydroxylase [Diaphorobacter sp. HDW4B]
MDESTTTTADGLDLPKADLTQRSVNVLRRRDNGFVEFEFSVGWPELVVELMMTQPDFEQFCQRQHIPIPISVSHHIA